MSPVLRKVAGALLAAVAMGIGTALGELARDAVKERFAPKPEPEPETRRRRRAKR